MTYHIQTPVLQSVSTGLMGVFDEAINGKADIKQGNLAVAAGSNIRRAIDTDLKVRLAQPKLDKIEAKAEKAKK